MIGLFYSQNSNVSIVLALQNEHSSTLNRPYNMESIEGSGWEPENMLRNKLDRNIARGTPLLPKS